MKVALVIDRFDPSRGGGESYAASLASGLVDKGHDVHVYASNTAPMEGIRFHRIRMVKYPRWAKSLTLSRSALRALREEAHDIIQGFGGIPWVDVYRPGGGVELAWLRSDVRSRHGGTVRVLHACKRILGFKWIVELCVERRVYTDPNGPEVIANSQMVKELILRYFPRAASHKIHVIHNGVDLGRFNPKNRQTLGKELREKWGRGGDDVLILFLAHNFRLKGLHQLIQALGILRGHTTTWRLIVAGRGNKAPFLRQSERLGLGGRVHFVGEVERPEAILAACDVLVHPTFYDPFANVCLEAMASGLPVITSRNNGAAELIQDGVSGYVVGDPRDEEVLSDRIERLFNREKRESMGQAARLEAEGHSTKGHVSRVLSIYERVLKERKLR